MTKLTNHQFCLMSDDDLRNFLWQLPQTGLSGATRSNRSFNLKVTKNQEQQRNVEISEGFDVSIRILIRIHCLYYLANANVQLFR